MPKKQVKKNGNSPAEAGDLTLPEGVVIRRRSISEYVPDPHNANRGTERGLYMIERSVGEVGLARSIVAAADDTVPAGNKTLESAAEAGFDEVIEVETDGRQLVVVKRRDWQSVDDEQARLYAYYDNRSSEVGLDWNDEQVLADIQAGVDLSGLWQQDELDALVALAQGAPDLDTLAEQYGEPGDRDFWPVIRVQVAPETHELWQQLMAAAPSDDDAEKMAQILEAVDEALLG